MRSRAKLAGFGSKRSSRSGRKSIYMSGDSAAWLKFKLRQTEEFVVGGVVPPMRALVVGCCEGEELRFVGQVYAGLDKWSRRALTEQLTPHITNTCPFSNLPMRGRGQFGEGISAADMNAYQWLRPGVVVQIEFQEWTSGGLLRHPKFAGVRL